MNCDDDSLIRHQVIISIIKISRYGIIQYIIPFSKFAFEKKTYLKKFEIEKKQIRNRFRNSNNIKIRIRKNHIWNFFHKIRKTNI